MYKGDKGEAYAEFLQVRRWMKVKALFTNREEMLPKKSHFSRKNWNANPRKPLITDNWPKLKTNDPNNI